MADMKSAGRTVARQYYFFFSHCYYLINIYLATKIRIKTERCIKMGALHCKKVDVSFCHLQNMSLLCTNFEANNESTGNQK